MSKPAKKPAASPKAGKQKAQPKGKVSTGNKGKRSPKGKAAAKGAVNPLMLQESEEPRGNPGQTSQEELETRVAFTVALLQKGWRKGKIKLHLKRAFRVSARTCENYLSRAREELVQETGKARSDHVADLYAIATGVIEDPNASHTDRLKAVREIRHLLLIGTGRTSGATVNQQINIGGGLPAADLSGDDGEAQNVSTAQLDLESRRTRVRAVAERIRARGIPLVLGQSGADRSGAPATGELADAR